MGLELGDHLITSTLWAPSSLGPFPSLQSGDSHICLIGPHVDTLCIHSPLKTFSVWRNHPGLVPALLLWKSLSPLSAPETT